MHRPNILVIGDSCVDTYRIGTVTRLSPEAPVPIIKVIDEFRLPGMAANVNTNINTLGFETEFVTNKETISKLRYIDQKSGQHLLRVDIENNLVPYDSIRTLDLNQFDLVVVSDYNKGFMSYDLIEYICYSSPCPVFIDTKKQELKHFNYANTFIKINEIEFEALKSHPANLIVTLGKDGAKFIQGNNSRLFSTDKVEVLDVCGCGDTFLAALSVKYMLTKDIEQSIMYANKAAGITARHRGNYAPTIKEIDCA